MTWAFIGGFESFFKERELKKTKIRLQMSFRILNV